MEELLTISSADFLDLSYQHNVLPPELPFAAFRVNKLHLNLLIIVIPSSKHNKEFYCDNCSTLGQRLASQLSSLTYNPTQTPVLRRLRIQQDVPIATQLNSQLPKVII